MTGFQEGVDTTRSAVEGYRARLWTIHQLIWKQKTEAQDR